MEWALFFDVWDNICTTLTYGRREIHKRYIRVLRQTWTRYEDVRFPNSACEEHFRAPHPHNSKQEVASPFRIKRWFWIVQILQLHVWQIWPLNLLRILQFKADAN